MTRQQDQTYILYDLRYDKEKQVVIKMRRAIPLIIIIYLCFSGCGQAFAYGNWDNKFSEQINVWITQLSQKDPLFSNWKQSEWKSQSLGPNSKQWLITLYKKKETVGYLVVGQDDKEQLVLFEYGLDGINLFEPGLLNYYHSDKVKRAKSIKLVYQGLSSFFHIELKNEEIIIDGKTGEQIPQEFIYNKKNQTIDLAPKKVGNQLVNFYSKPLSSWDEAFPVEAIIKKTLPLSDLTQIQHRNAYLKSAIWNDHINLLLPIVGWHQWSEDETFIAVEQEGYRFLPLSKRKETDGTNPTVSLDRIIVMESDFAIAE